MRSWRVFEKHSDPYSTRWLHKSITQVATSQESSMPDSEYEAKDA